MGDELSSAAPARAGTSLLSALIAGCAAGAMAWATRALYDTSRIARGEDALIGWVLTGLAAIGIVLCLYLVVIWALAALIVLAGPASRLGAALLAALRVLAPRLARRVAVGTAVAGATTGLVLAPVLAAQNHGPIADGVLASTASTLQLHPTAPAVPSVTAESAGAPFSGASSEADPRSASASSAPEDALPALGWGGAPASPSAGSPAESSEAPSHTVVVQRGDSLWSITDDLLGPGIDDPQEIAAAWPRLHDANREVIGPDPDHLVPGQELVIPTALTPQETS